jgi:HEAT repeat protein
MGRAVGLSADSTEALLRASVVAIEVKGEAPRSGMLGSGFLVASRVVATCAHVLADYRDELPSLVTGYVQGGERKLGLVPVRAWYHRDDPDGLDLAFLWVTDDVDLPYALLSAASEVEDMLMAYGHPQGSFRSGQTATFRYAGPSRLGAGDAAWEAHRVHGIPVSAGYSGSPVLNLRTGAVRGMLCLSNDRGSAHMVGAEDILAHLPDEASGAQARSDTWLATLTDEQLRATGWRYPGPRLRAYLEATVRAASLSAYPAADGGSRSPDQPVRYVDQAAIRARQPDGAPIEVTATSIFGQDEDALVLGGPGMGKSTLLRMGLVSCARDWLVGPRPEVAPVLVQAADLVGQRPLPQLIAASIEASLSPAGLLDAWPAEFFAAEPAPGTRWLVLVDGLDDILDPGTRRAVLTKLAGIAADPSAGYQFIIASRPLPADELAHQEAWLTTHFRLRPFDSARLRRFAEGFLQALGPADAAHGTERLVGELDRARLFGVARAPLLAAMLCQLFAISPNRPLPSSLTDIYEEFVHALAAPQYVAGSRGIFAQADSAFRPYGPTALQAVTDVLDRAPALLGRLALARRDGDTRSAEDLLTTWEADSRPAQIPERKWREFLSNLLRRSGLLTERLGDFRFTHDSIADYLAARAVITDEGRSITAFEELFYRWHRPWPGVEPTWRPPSWPYSYTRFLIALWPGKTRTADALRQVARDGGLTGCDFVLSLAEDGIVVDHGVIEAAWATLARVASTSVSYGFAARRALALLTSTGATDTLAAVMTAERTGEEIRIQAAVALAEYGDERGTDRLTALASDTDRDALDRFNAWAALNQLDPARAAGFLVTVFPALAAQLGASAAGEYLLDRMGRAEGMEPIAQIAADESFPPEYRDMAAALLGRYGDSRVIDALATSASRPEIAAGLRGAVLTALAKINTPEADSALLSIAENDALSGRVRLQVITRLARQHRPSALGQLTSIAADSRMGTDARISAVALLAEMRLTRSLQALAAPRGDDHRVRMAAIRSIITQASEVDAQTLAAFTRDPQVDPSLRINAAQALNVLGHPEAPEIFAMLAMDASVGPELQRSAAELANEDAKTDEFGDPIAIASALQQFKRGKVQSQQSARVFLFTKLSQWPAIVMGDTTEPDRIVAVPQCLAELAWSSQDESFGPLIRWSAKATLEHLEHPTAEVQATLDEEIADPAELFMLGTAEICLKLINAAVDANSNAPDAGEDPMRERAIARRLELIRSYAENPMGTYHLRRYSAETVARLGDERGNEVLAELMRDPEQGLYSRCDAAVSLARADDSRGTNFLRTVAANQAVPKKTRLRATWLLRTLSDPEAERFLRRLSRKLPQASRDIRYSSDLDVALGVRAQLADSSATVDPEVRKMAAHALAQFRDAEAIRNLVTVTTHAHSTFNARRQAITSLALQGAADELAVIAEDTDIDSTVRCWAAEETAWLADSRGAEVLVALVSDESVDSYTRRRAAFFLARLGDPRGTRLLAHLATDPESTVDARQTATQLLTQMHYVENLQSIILAPDASDEARSYAIDILASHCETDALLDLRQRRDLPVSARQRIARVAQRSRSRKGKLARH